MQFNPTQFLLALLFVVSTTNAQKVCRVRPTNSSSLLASSTSISTSTAAPRATTTSPMISSTIKAAPAPSSAPASSVYSATLTNYDPTTGGGACDGVRYGANDHIVALSTYILYPNFPSQSGSNCHRYIKITVKSTGASLVARVVDECDQLGGCRPDNVDGTPGVWSALNVDLGVGVEQIDFHYVS